MRSLLCAALALLAAGCEVVDRPNRPVPSDFEATLLDGTRLDGEALRRGPWVVNIWVPG